MTDIKISLPFNNELLKIRLYFSISHINTMALFSIYIMDSSSQWLVKLLILSLAQKAFAVSEHQAQNLTAMEH